MFCFPLSLFIAHLLGLLLILTLTFCLATHRTLISLSLSIVLSHKHLIFLFLPIILSYLSLLGSNYLKETSHLSLPIYQSKFQIFLLSCNCFTETSCLSLPIYLSTNQSFISFSLAVIVLLKHLSYPSLPIYQSHFQVLFFLCFSLSHSISLCVSLHSFALSLSLHKFSTFILSSWKDSTSFIAYLLLNYSIMKKTHSISLSMLIICRKYPNRASPNYLLLSYHQTLLLPCVGIFVKNLAL